MIEEEKCDYDGEDGCNALACWSSQECFSRDEKGNLKYVKTDIILEEMRRKTK